MLYTNEKVFDISHRPYPKLCVTRLYFGVDYVIFCFLKLLRQVNLHNTWIKCKNMRNELPFSFLRFEMFTEKREEIQAVQ